MLFQMIWKSNLHVPHAKYQMAQKCFKYLSPKYNVIAMFNTAVSISAYTIHTKIVQVSFTITKWKSNAMLRRETDYIYIYS